MVLETVARPSRDRVVIASGFGTQAQWFRNLAADPRCHMSIGVRARVPALARVLTPDESAAVLAGYRCDRPRAYRSLGRIVEEATGAGIDEVPMVELTMDRRSGQSARGVATTLAYRQQSRIAIIGTTIAVVSDITAVSQPMTVGPASSPR
ncbi:hypothetical protein NG2371_01460 [Nocardia gamkensis]|nr:hypothetical protein [Nocardia gamkensis]